MIDIDLKDNYQAITAALNQVSGKIDDLTPLMKIVSGIMADAVEENFEREGRPKWKDLKPSTKKQRKKKGHYPGKILQVSGRLAAAVESTHSKNSASVYIGGSEFPYAAIHNFGGKAGRGHKAEIPARPYLDLGEDDLDEIQEEISKYLRNL